MANWTPDGFIGQLFKTLGRRLPPPAGVSSPALWGSRLWLEEIFAKTARSISIVERDFIFRYASANHFIDTFRTYYGPVHKAFLSLDPAGQEALTSDLLDLVARFNKGADGTMRIPSAYAEVVVTRD